MTHIHEIISSDFFNSETNVYHYNAVEEHNIKTCSTEKISLQELLVILVDLSPTLE